MQTLPKILTPEEAKAWGLPEMIPLFPSEAVLAIEAQWAKKDLQAMAEEYLLSTGGDKELLVHKLVYIGALDKEGVATGMPVAPAQVPYVIDGPRKFCCRLCGDCAPEEFLKEGRFFDRMAWLRRHYQEKHPGVWGKGKSVPAVIRKDLEELVKGGAPEFIKSHGRKYKLVSVEESETKAAQISTNMRNHGEIIIIPIKGILPIGGGYAVYRGE